MGGRQNFFRWVEVLFITDFRRLGGEWNNVFRWVVGLFSVVLIQNKKLLENGSNCPFSCLDFYTSYLYVRRFRLSTTSTNGDPQTASAYWLPADALSFLWGQPRFGTTLQCSLLQKGNRYPGNEVGASSGKNTSSFSFFSSPFIFGLESRKIYANFSGEIVTSSSVLDHRDSWNIRSQIIWPTANFRPQTAHLGPRNFRPQTISPTPNKHISIPVPKVKELPPGVSI